MNAAHYWAAVEECLVRFHGLERGQAAAKVTELWRRLPSGPEPRCGEPSFEDMIYHAEPWYVACNLAGQEQSPDSRQVEYASVLRQNGLA